MNTLNYAAELVNAADVAEKTNDTNRYLALSLSLSLKSEAFQRAAWAAFKRMVKAKTW